MIHCWFLEPWNTLQSRTGPVQGQNRVFPVKFFSQGKPCFHYREPVFSLQGPCFHYRDFPVRKTSQGKPCFHYREWVCSVNTHPQFGCYSAKSTVRCSVFYAKVSFITSPFSAIKVYGSFYVIEGLWQHDKNVIEYSYEYWIKDLKCTWTSYWHGYASYSLLLAVWLVVHIVEAHAVYKFDSKALATIYFW